MGPVLPTQPNGEVGVIDAGMALDLQRGLHPDRLQQAAWRTPGVSPGGERVKFVLWLATAGWVPAGRIVR
jgi:hypothetical protein